MRGWLRRGELAPHKGMRVVGWDAVGGFVALDADGRVHHLPQDGVLWEELELDLDELDDWAESDDAAEYWADDLWPGWQDEVTRLAANEVFEVDPPPWARKPGEQPSRTPVRVEEAWKKACANLDRLG